MSKTNIPLPLTQSALRSKVVRIGLTELQAGHNNLQDQVDALLTPPGGSEVTNARDYFSVLRDRIRNAGRKMSNRLIYGGELTEQGIPDMTFHVALGGAEVDGVGCSWAAADSGTITAPGSNTRLDYIVSNSDNTISVVAGTSAVNPVFPAIASTQLILGALVIKSTTTAIREGIELFTFRSKDNNFYPNIYVNADTTLTENKNYNNLIIDGVKFDTASYSANCQGFAHLVGVDNSADSTGSQVSSSDTVSGNSTFYKVLNYGGDSLTNGTPGKTGSSTYYKAGSGGNGYSIKIKAFSIYVWGTNGFGGNNGVAGTTVNSLDAGNTTISSGEDGGNGGNAGAIHLEAINEIINYGTINGIGANGGAGKAESTGTQYNLGGKGGASGAGSQIIFKARAVTAGTTNLSAGTPGAGGVGSGGSGANANGSTGATGATGATTTTLWNGAISYPSDYADWMRNIEA